MMCIILSTYLLRFVVVVDIFIGTVGGQSVFANVAVCFSQFV